MKLRWLLPFLLALPLAAQTITTLPSGMNCGLGLPINCYNIPTTSGYLWIDSQTTGYSHFIEFYDLNHTLTGQATDAHSFVTVITPIPAGKTATATNNAYEFFIPSFTQVNVDGTTHAGSIVIRFHYEYFRGGGGRGGGGGGNRLIIDSGTLTID